MTTSSFAISNAPTSSNSNQPIVVWGELNDKSAAIESIAPKLQPTPQFIQQQNAISNEYNQKQQAIAEEEEYMADMEFDMFDGPYWGDDMYDGYTDVFAGPGVIIPIGKSNDSTTPSKPKMIGYYESQLQNGDIIFKQ